MVTGHGGRSGSAATIARPLAAAPARIGWLLLTCASAIVLLTAAVPAEPVLLVLAAATAVLVGLRLVTDRGRSMASWSWAAAVVALVALSGLSGPVTGSDPASVLLLPLAAGCLAVLVVMLASTPGGVARRGSLPSWAGPACDGLVAALAVAAFAVQDVLPSRWSQAGDLSGTVVSNVTALVVLAATTAVVVGRRRASGEPALETLAALVLSAAGCCAADLAYLAGAVHAQPARLPLAGAARWQDVAAVALLAGVGAAALAGPEGSGRPAPARRRELTVTLVGVLPCALVLVRAVFLAVGGEGLRPGAVVAGLAMVSALLLRYAAARLEVLVLDRTLEERVEQRTLELGTREQWFRSLVQNSSDVLTVLDDQGVVRYQSPAMQRVFGHDPALLIGTPLSYLMRPTDARRLAELLAEARDMPRATSTLEFALWHREGRWSDTETTVTTLIGLTGDPELRGHVLNTRDISERKRLEDALTHQAFHDTLTGLANRALFQDRVGHAMRNAKGAASVGVLFLDLDGFKGVNDTQGHAVGDVLLGLVAERLKHCIRPSDTVARLGGDEFAVLVEDADCTRAAGWVAERIVATLNQPFLLDGRALSIGVSVGIALNSRGRESEDELLRNADVAMYRAKAGRQGGWVRFEDGMRDALVERLELENDLKLALGRGQLAVYYLPTVELARGLVVGAEALVRWHHPVRGLLAPDGFIAVAEESGLIVAIGEHVLREACRAGARWQVWAPQGQQFHVAVNISARQLDGTIVETVRSALADSGLPPAALVLEVRESVLVERTEEILSLLHQLKALGVRLAIDDFGTGYSSLSYLSRFPVDILKVDRSFVEAFSVEGSEHGELARTILHLGQSMHLSTVAEGIETQSQYAMLRAMGCDYGQGYLFARPLPPAGLDELLSCRLLEHQASAPPAPPTPTPAPLPAPTRGDPRPRGS